MSSLCTGTNCGLTEHILLVCSGHNRVISGHRQCVVRSVPPTISMPHWIFTGRVNKHAGMLIRYTRVHGDRFTVIKHIFLCKDSRVRNKHAGMLIYSTSKNQVRHAYCGRHTANDTLPVTLSCRLHTSVCLVSPKLVVWVYQG